MLMRRISHSESYLINITLNLSNCLTLFLYCVLNFLLIDREDRGRVPWLWQEGPYEAYYGGSYSARIVAPSVIKTVVTHQADKIC